MSKEIDLTGIEYEHFTVIEKSRVSKTSGGYFKAYWKCQCKCGKIFEAEAQKIRKETIKSCGCQKKQWNKNNYEDITGMRFGSLTVIRRLLDDEMVSKRTPWLCVCDCGKMVHENAYKMQHGAIVSCGCKKHTRLADNTRKHGMTNNRIYYIYNSMKERCNLSSNRNYSKYGARGISVCDEWNDKDGFCKFYEWALSNGYKDNLTLDRIDNNGNYEPSNCRWVSNIEQQNNKRNNIFVDMNGETHTIAEWSRILGCSYGRAYKDLRKFGYKKNEVK